MKRNTAIIISFALLLLSVPWLFTGTSDTMIMGFPTWAFYNIAVTFVYALFLIFLLGTMWDKMEE